MTRRHQRTLRRNRRRTAFSLIEMLVVIATLSLISLVIVGFLTTVKQINTQAATRSDRIEALETFRRSLERDLTASADVTLEDDTLLLTLDDDPMTDTVTYTPGENHVVRTARDVDQKVRLPAGTGRFTLEQRVIVWTLEPSDQRGGLPWQFVMPRPEATQVESRNENEGEGE